MKKRYEIQACDLIVATRKSEVVWHEITTSWTEKGARKKFWNLASNNTDELIFRVFDRKTGKAVA